ncbi:MAG: CpsD/CapB family tyrosine-protein kinase [Ruminococcaceae bacterium]|nr:CpsD/CapB family tyrosine-protein kinase [Oscillospiraceae bacterium]
MEKKQHKPIKLNKRKKANAVDDKYEVKLIDKNTPFAIREAFGSLRTNLLYAATGSESGSIFAVTSARESVGKSFVITNLAVSFAQAGKRVLLLDADMRCPVQQFYFGHGEDRQGLSEYLSGQVDNVEDVVTPSPIEGLYLLSSGRVPPNPSELVLSERFKQMLLDFSHKYDYVFVDFPPVGIVSDAAVVADVITGYVFLVRSGISKEQVLSACLEQMESLGAKVVGIVLNDVEAKGSGGRYGKYGKYNKYRKYAKYSSYSRYRRYQNT